MEGRVFAVLSLLQLESCHSEGNSDQSVASE